MLLVGLGLLVFIVALIPAIAIGASIRIIAGLLVKL